MSIDFRNLKSSNPTFINGEQIQSVTDYGGSCGSGGRAGHPLIPGSSSPHVEVALGKLLNPQIAPKGCTIGVCM